MADEPPPPDSSGNTQTAGAQGGFEDRSWERSWTLDEMRKGASDWSLAGDAGLLLYLQEFSQKMISRTHEIEKEVAKLVHDSKLTGVRVNNVFNDFMMLSNTQFVENRVYDEDVNQEETPQEEKKAENQEKTREQREAELIPKVTEAIKLGVDVIEEAFEKLDTNIDDSDSEDDDDAYRVDPILEAKDPYLDRPLPYLIGTPNFLQDDNLGLRDISDEEDSDHGSISETESEDEEEEKAKDESEYSSSESDSDADIPARKPSRAPKSDEDSDSDSDMFSERKHSEAETESSDQDEEDEPKKPPPPAGPVDFASELASKLGGAPPKAPSPQLAGDGGDSEEEEVPTAKHKEHERRRKKSKDKERSKSKSKPKKHKDEEEDLFAPAQDSDDGDLFGAGMFSKKGGGIFDKDDSDEGGLFDDDVKKAPEPEDVPEEKVKEEVHTKRERKRTRTTSSGRKVPAGGVSVFGEPKAPSGGSGGLFDDDDEDDLFGSAPAKPASAPVKREEKKSALFDDDEEDEDDMFGGAKKEEPVKKDAGKSAKPKGLPAGAVPMFGAPGAKPLAAALKKQRQDSDEEDNDWSDGEKSHSSSIKSSQSETSRQSGKMIESQSKDSLFAGEPDEISPVTKPKSNSISRNAKLTKGLFDNDEGEDDLFGTSTKPSKPTASVAKTESKAKPKASGLFNDDEDDDLFGATTAPAEPVKKKPPAGAVSIFPTDPFGKKKEAEKKEDEPVKRPPSKSISMFDADDDDGDSLFGTAPPKAAPPAKKQAQPGAKPSIFDAGDSGGGLFGGDDDDAGDIFTKPASPVRAAPTERKKSDTTTSVTTVTKPVAQKPKSSADLFGGDDEDDDDDLFGTGPPKSSKPAGTVAVAGVTKTESSDTVDDTEEKPVEPEGKKWKPPVGGVSMFGPGAPKLLQSSLRKTSDAGNEEKKAETATRKTEPKKKEVSDPLFGEDNEDDLFGAPVKKKEEVKKTAEPVQTEVKKSAGPVKQTQEVKKSVEPVHERPSSLFPASADTDREGPPPLESNGALDDSDEDDLFGTGKQGTTKPEETPKPSSPARHKPVGGVSMFGGMDPFAAMKKKPPSPEPAPVISPGLSSPEDLFSSPKRAPVVEEDKSKPVKTAAMATSPAKGKIGKLQANLNFNPAAMLPGSAPPVKEPAPLEIGFDVPAEARTLQSANKDRAKIQSKRRPPSRHARKAAAAQSPVSPTDEFFASPGSLSPSLDFSGSLSPDLSGSLSPDRDLDPSRVPPPIAESPPRVSQSDTAAVSRPKADMFGNDDLFGSDLPKPKTKSVIDSKSANPGHDDMFSGDTFSGAKPKGTSDNFDDLFSSPKTDVKPKSGSMVKNTGDDDDLFGSVPKTKSVSKKERVKSEAKEEKSSKPPVSLVDDDDDIFAVKKKKSKPKPSPIIDDDDDDLFSSPSLSKPSTKPSKESGKRSEQNGSIGKDDDTFADSKSKGTTAVDDKEDDAIFAAAMPQKKKPKKVVTKDEDIFDDDTDIFSEVPKAKPKEKKVKKKTTASSKKTIFKDDVDDIFADTSATGKPKEKKKEKKKTSKETSDKAKQAAEDIFNDPLLS